MQEIIDSSRDKERMRIRSIFDDVVQDFCDIRTNRSDCILVSHGEKGYQFENVYRGWIICSRTGSLSMPVGLYGALSWHLWFYDNDDR